MSTVGTGINRQQSKSTIAASGQSSNNIKKNLLTNADNSQLQLQYWSWRNVQLQPELEVEVQLQLGNIRNILKLLVLPWK